MQIELKYLKELIQEVMSGSGFDESYDKLIVNDDSFDRESKIVPLKRKKKIKSWLKNMGLA